MNNISVVSNSSILIGRISIISHSSIHSDICIIDTQVTVSQFISALWIGEAHLYNGNIEP